MELSSVLSKGETNLKSTSKTMKREILEQSRNVNSYKKLDCLDKSVCICPTWRTALSQQMAIWLSLKSEKSSRQTEIERTIKVRTEVPPWNDRGLTRFYTRTTLNG